jgi:hypothetical protein
MRYITIILILFSSFSSFSYGSTKEKMAIGQWLCEPYTVENDGDQFAFDVSHTVEYRDDGTSTDIHTYKMRGFEEQVWIKVSYSGPWKIEGDILYEVTEATKIIETSIPDLKDSKELLQALSSEDSSFVSDIIELSISKFTTRDKDVDEAVTCLKV